jgi:peptidoglycan/LPS O-acetylase OafA/YrhL
VLICQPLVQGLSENHGSYVAVPLGALMVMFLATAAASVSYALIEAPCMNLGRRAVRAPALPVASF